MHIVLIAGGKWLYKYIMWIIFVWFSIFFCPRKYFTCSACELRSPSFEHSKFVNITPLCGDSLRELLKQGLDMEVLQVLFTM